jgi:hypothetical protein
VSGVTAGRGLEPRPESVGTFEALRAELARLRVRGARGSGKAQLSLRDVAATSSIPRTTLANYLSGASIIPADQLDAVVLALGATPDEATAWAAAWERAMDHRLAGGDMDGEPQAPAPAPEPQAPTPAPEPEAPTPALDQDKPVAARAAVPRRWALGIVIAAAIALLAGVAGDQLLLDPSPSDQPTPSGPDIASAPQGPLALCWPVTGDWDEPNNPRDHTTKPGSVTVAVACKEDHGMPWIGTNVPGGGPPQTFGGYGNSDICLPVTGDWDGDGRTTAGAVCRAGSDLRWGPINSIAGGSASYPPFYFGNADSCWPVTGDWDGDGRTTPGAACQDGPNLRWNLTNSPTGGSTSYPPFVLGSPDSCRPVTGDWNGDRTTTAGAACYTTAGIRWHLSDSPITRTAAYPPFVLGDASTFQPQDGGGWRGPPWPHRPHGQPR